MSTRVSSDYNEKKIKRCIIKVGDGEAPRREERRVLCGNGENVYGQASNHTHMSL